jgi:hypothetical protein
MTSPPVPAPTKRGEIFICGGEGTAHGRFLETAIRQLSGNKKLVVQFTATSSQYSTTRNAAMLLLTSLQKLAEWSNELAPFGCAEL